MMKIKFLIGVLLILMLANVTVEARTTLSNCIEICDDTSGCTCPNYCSTTGNIDYDVNCGGQPTVCSQENRRYWVSDGDCQATCGDYDDEFMITKGWERVDYNCYTEEPLEKEEEITEETTEEQEVEEPIQFREEGFPLFVGIVLVIVLLLIIFWMIFKKKKRGDKYF